VGYSSPLKGLVNEKGFTCVVLHEQFAFKFSVVSIPIKIWPKDLFTFIFIDAEL